MGSKLCQCNNNNENQKLETNAVKNFILFYFLAIKKRSNNK